VIAIIKECGGKMYMSEKKWQQALVEFQESFKCYVDCGSTQARTLLKYVIWTAMLAKSEFDVQGTQEAQIYKNDDLIVGMTKLGIGFQNNDLELI
jgi:COP9 signalosome complex subunit 2